MTADLAENADGKNKLESRMPSPFPGMDPYLEAPDIWPDFHHAFACELSGVFNEVLPPLYYGRIAWRPEFGIVEIRDSKRAHKLITLIENVSPSNKRPGKDRDSYLAKQREVLASDASLVEIDLLRGVERLLAADAAAVLARQSVPVDYLIVVTRRWGREQCRLYLASVRQVLPVVGIPLRREEAEVPLDVQFAVNRAYDGGPYRRGAVDYGAPPAPPLRAADVAWADQLLAPLRQSKTT